MLVAGSIKSDRRWSLQWGIGERSIYKIIWLRRKSWRWGGWWKLYDFRLSEYLIIWNRRIYCSLILKLYYFGCSLWADLGDSIIWDIYRLSVGIYIKLSGCFVLHLINNLFYCSPSHLAELFWRECFSNFFVDIYRCKSFAFYFLNISSWHQILIYGDVKTAFLHNASNTMISTSAGLRERMFLPMRDAVISGMRWDWDTADFLNAFFNGS